MSAYRSTDKSARFVCLLCFAQAARASMGCPACDGNPMVTIDDAGVKEVLRLHAYAKTETPYRRRLWIGAGVAAVFSVAVFMALQLIGVGSVSTHGHTAIVGSGDLWLLAVILAVDEVAGLALVSRFSQPPTPRGYVDELSGAGLVEFLGIPVIDVTA